MKTASAHLEALCARHPLLAACRAPIEQAADALTACFRGGGKLLLAGNGGSAADCLHIAGELLKGFCLPRPLDAGLRVALAAQYGDEGVRLGRGLQQGVPAIALGAETALTTAVANDLDAEFVFAQGVMALGAPGDCFLGLSTSGTARNVIAAARLARARGLRTLALTGMDGGELARLSDIVILAPGETTAQIQEYHLPIYHSLCAAVEDALYGNDQ